MMDPSRTFVTLGVLALSYACHGASARSGVTDDRAGKASVAPPASIATAAPPGQVVVLKGPCGKRPCCKPVSVTLPLKLESGVFSPVISMKLVVRPDGVTEKVEFVKSSGVETVDRQLREGATQWCFEKTKEGREVYHTVNLHLRRAE